MRTGLICLLLGLCAPLWALGAENVLIVENSKATGSREVAEFYAKVRGVAKERILSIAASDKEEITRDEFKTTIWEPVRKAVLADDTIKIIVPCWGVPLKVKETDGKDDKGAFEGRDFASVDSELMLCRAESYELQAAYENPLLVENAVLGLPLAPTKDILIVSRLDGPTKEIALGLVEKAILAEFLTPEGKNYLDTRGPGLQAGYKQRDDDMQKVADGWKEIGLNYTHDEKPDVVDLSTFDNPLHYYGWYAGSQKPKGEVKFRTGAIAVHLHSFSAATVRNTQHNWVAPLLSWNATCTYGTVYEPYTVGYPYEWIMWGYLAKGMTFGEAGLGSNHLLSWQSVFIGDPLYRPYGEGWKERKDAHRQALLALLQGQEASVDEPYKAALTICAELIQARAKLIVETVKGDAAKAMTMLLDLNFLVRDFGLDAGVGKMVEGLNGELVKQFDAIKAATKKDITDTAGLEAARANWRGLPVHKDVEALHDDLMKQQEKKAEPLLKKAQSALKSKKHLQAYQLFCDVERYRLSTQHDEAKAARTGLLADEAIAKKLAEDANKELKPLRDKAEAEKKRKAWAKIITLLEPLYRYPDCDQRKACQALLEEAEKNLPPKK